MQLFRSLCVVAVLGALTYGAYVTLTGSPPVEPPLVGNYDSVPTVVLPSPAAPGVSSSVAASTGGASTPAPKFGLAVGPGAARLDAPTDSAGGTPMKPTILDVRSNGIAADVPLSYPKTAAPPGPFDSASSIPMANAAGSPTAGGSALPGVSLSAAGSPAASPVTPVVSTAPNAAPNASLIQSTPGGAANPSAVPFGEIQALATTKPAEALEKLSRWFDDPTLPPEQTRAVSNLLDQLAGTVIYSREHLLEPAHVVQPGERLDQIAAQYQVPWELLAKINGIADPANIAPGTQLKVIRGPFGCLVDKSRRQLSVFLGGIYAGSFAVGFGQDQPPADGSYLVREKRGPQVDPSNPLRWLDLGNGLAIHTALDGVSLEDDNARGCIRLNPAEAADVFDILSVGSEVVVRP